MNVELLEKVKAHVLEEPLRLDMGIAMEPSCHAPCGAVGCIAGWGVVLREPDKKAALSHWGHRAWGYVICDPEGSERGDGEIFWEAMDAFDLDEDQAARLFHDEAWSPAFQLRLREWEEGTRQYAEIVAERIDHFIRTGGAE